MDQRTTELSERVARLERRLAETERSRRGIRAPLLLRRLLPAATRTHLREARRHMWLAVRAVVDARIESPSTDPAEQRPHETEERPGPG